MAVLQQIWLYEIIGGTVRVVTDVSKYHNAGTMEHRLKDIVFYVKKHIAPCTVVITSLLVRDKPLGALTSVKRVYW